MKIEVKNLGPITSATIDLSKKLNVFCGENNTGKTYLAYLIYHLNLPEYPYRSIRSASEILDLISADDIPNKKFRVDFSNSKALFEQRLSEYKMYVEDIFGISESDRKTFFGMLKVKGRSTISDFKESFIDVEFKRDFEYQSDGRKHNILVEKRKGEDFIMTHETPGLTVQSLFIILDDLFDFERTLSNLIFPQNCFFSTIERNSIFTFSKELSLRRSQVIDDMHKLNSKGQKNLGQLLEERTSRYPNPIRDGLFIAEDLGNLSRKISSSSQLAKEIEIDILNGQLNVNKLGEMEFEPQTATNLHLPIKLSASTIKTLSGLVFYLKHLAEEGDLVIIDEPELNLHPENQILIARVFARMIQSGFKLLISTHSDYIIREINNLIMVASLGDIEKDLAKELGYKENEFIKPEDVGVHYFHYQNEKVVVDDLEVKSFGFEVPSIEKTINELNQRAADLYYALDSDEVENND